MRESRLKLTDRSVAALLLPSGKAEQTFWDTDVRGFGVRLRADRAATWIIQYQIGSQQRRKTIGQVSAMDAAAARKEARTLRAKVELKEDVVLSLRARVAKAEELKRGDKTFGALIGEYLEWQKTRRRKNDRVGLSPRWQFQVEKHLNFAAAPLHKLPLADITRQHVADCITALHRKNGPSAGNNVRASLSAFFGWAIERGKVNANPVIGSPREEQSSRDRVLTPPELRIIWRTLPDNHFGAIVRLLLLTGQRRSEIGDLRWNEVHDRQIVLPASRTKNGLPHVVPLSDQALGIIKAQPRRIDSSGKLRDLIFGIGDGAFTGWSKSKERLDAAIAKELRKPLPDWTLHDLRRSVATYMGGDLPHHLLVKLSPKDRKLGEGLGVQPHVIEATLNHISGHKAGVAGVYQRGTYEVEKGAALDKWAQRLLEIVDSTNIASLRGAA